MAEARTIDAVIGRTGFGKTSITKQLAARARRVIVLERFTEKNEYDAKRFLTWQTFSAFLVGIKPGQNFRVSFAPGSTYFGAVLEMAWALGDVTLVIEELPSYIPSTAALPWQFIEVVERGRHRGLSIIATAQRPMRIPIMLRSEVDRMWVFRLTELTDRTWLENFPGANREIAEKAGDLERYRFMVVDSNGGCKHGQTKK